MDEKLIERCLDGDALAIERFVGTYRQDVYRLVSSILDDPDETEDGVQEAFLAALRGLDSFRGNSSFTTWLYAITINICRARLQRQKTRQRLQGVVQGLFHLQQKTHESSPEETVIKNEFDAHIWRTIRSLDEKHCLPVILRYYHDFSVAQIAEALGLPQGTIHSRLNTARERLRSVLKEGQK